MITGCFTCKRCSCSNEWYYIIPERISRGRFTVHKLPENKNALAQKPYFISETDGIKKYSMTCYCKCGCLNTFEYETDRDL